MPASRHTCAKLCINDKYYGLCSHENKLPLLDNLLANAAFRAYYLDHMDYLLDTTFRTDEILDRIGTDGSGGLWDRGARSGLARAATTSQASCFCARILRAQGRWRALKFGQNPRDTELVLFVP